MTASATPCLDENAIVALTDGSMPPGERTLSARHLDTCAPCRAAVGSFVRITAPETDAALARTVASDRPPPMTVRRGLSAGVVVGNRYRLERIVGEGGLGEVWAATHTVTGRQVALKILKFTDPDLCKRFLREARIASAIRHPSIVPVHAVFVIETEGRLAMVMDLLEGESLAELLARRGAIPCHEALVILQPVLAALAAAHSLGVVHRDLKPQNIFLERAETSHAESGAVRAKLLDFGLAKLTATEGAAAMTSVLTREKSIMGTPLYMAPEQLYGEIEIDLRTDLWAVGVIFFECLTGRRPLEGGTLPKLLRSLATEDIPTLGSLAPDVPADLAHAVDALLARSPEARPAGVGPLAAIVDRLLAAD